MIFWPICHNFMTAMSPVLATHTATCKWNSNSWRVEDRPWWNSLQANTMGANYCSDAQNLRILMLNMTVYYST